jgi:peroxiredoxin Q/BCP
MLAPRVAKRHSEQAPLRDLLCAAKPQAQRALLSYDAVHVHVQKRQKKGIAVTIEDGTAAPDFELPDADGKMVKLSALRGRPVVVYFYPKDDTSGCTAEAKDFTCIAGDFKNAHTQVVGISPDSPASHRKFQEKHALGVRLLSDEARATAEAYGVWVEKSMYGRKYMGVERATFLIDKTGKIARSWRNVRVRGHADEVLAAARALKG